MFKGLFFRFEVSGNASGSSRCIRRGCTYRRYARVTTRINNSPFQQFDGFLMIFSMPLSVFANHVVNTH